jgi:hypothetical protein
MAGTDIQRWPFRQWPIRRTPATRCTCAASRITSRTVSSRFRAKPCEDCTTTRSAHVNSRHCRVDGVPVRCDSSHQEAKNWAASLSESTSPPAPQPPCAGRWAKPTCAAGRLTAVLAWGLLDQHHATIGEPFDPTYGEVDAVAALESILTAAIRECQHHHDRADRCERPPGCRFAGRV